MYKNIGFRLEKTWDGDAAIQCPQCKQKYDIEWDSEYGDASIGEHEATCLECDKCWTFGVYLRYT